jgi:hypothetical protein
MTESDASKARFLLMMSYVPGSIVETPSLAFQIAQTMV